MMDLILAIFKAGVGAHPFLTNRQQDECIRYIFCGVDKVEKVIQGILHLYPSLRDNPDMEMPLGILLRSLLMDGILHMKAKSIASQLDNTNQDAVYSELKEYCLAVLNDATNFFVEEIYRSQTMSSEQKADTAARFVQPFSRAFDLSAERPKIRQEYKLNLNRIAKEHITGGTEPTDAIYNLYSFYSKYDHLSHFTGLSNRISDNHKANKINLGILLIAMYLRDLLALAYNFDGASEGLLEIIEELSDAILNVNPDEFGEVEKT
ncbi:hypothetical protein A4H97_33955 [Niastella yeongjuensis]|uniref:Uncharacterized protein n=1 Tax=Niastella yeongjuensis TaxID=354355 RepID=A0A1V9EBE4_9BACT|nr:hypothetical protein [Niastella yeongjuensis]OQP43439.1 hypothetical protein A4H97_33955 [Niastella yeongjuensis]SEO75217.1 hypothetical protein SAMN05660816_03418 [Niastella yeongjuensis]